MDLTLAGLMALMLSLSPPERVTALSLASEQHETTPERSARYGAIASDILDVAEAHDVEPLFVGPRARERTALLLLATTFHESDGWHRSIDTGAKRGDGGASWCIAQIHLPGAHRTPEGWAGPDLIADRQRCLRAAVRVLRASLALCAQRPRPDRLSAYVSGSCSVSVDVSRRRWRTFEELVRQVASPTRGG
jgi:hypothetical protein